jgi:hypothetical protein
LAGLAGLLICLFPCGVVSGLVGTFHLAAAISGRIHNISAVIFFILLSYNSLFLFTKSNGEMTPLKKKRNVVFRVCGIGMVLSLLLIIPVTILGIYGGTWLVEALALGFFGVSWLTKANTIRFLWAEKE